MADAATSPVIGFVTLRSPAAEVVTVATPRRLRAWNTFSAWFRHRRHVNMGGFPDARGCLMSVSPGSGLSSLAWEFDAGQIDQPAVTACFS